MDRRIALIASGNAFFKDEGAGLYAAKYLKENFDFEPEIAFFDGGTLGFRLMLLNINKSDAYLGPSYINIL